MIELEIERASDANKASLEAFKEVKNRPVSEVSPIVPTSFGVNVGQTIGEYIKTPAFPGEKLRHLPTIGVNIEPNSILGDEGKCSRADHRDNCLRMANSVPGIITIRIDNRSRQLIACGSESAIKKLEMMAGASGHSFTRDVPLFANME